MGEEIAFENDRIYDFQGLVTLTLTLDRVILHTVMHQSWFIDLYLHVHTKFHWNWRNFLWTDVRTDGRTCGRTFETYFIRSTRRSRPNKNFCCFILCQLWTVNDSFFTFCNNNDSIFTVSQILPLLQCQWLPVAFRSPSFSKKQLKLNIS